MPLEIANTEEGLEEALPFLLQDLVSKEEMSEVVQSLEDMLRNPKTSRNSSEWRLAALLMYLIHDVNQALITLAKATNEQSRLMHKDISDDVNKMFTGVTQELQRLQNKGKIEITEH